MEKMGTFLEGGNMNKVILKNQLIYKDVNLASPTIDALLKHVRARGVDWVSESFGINNEEKHVLSYIEGEVPYNEPEWLWNESILMDIACRLRQWHDATLDFFYESAQWILKNTEKPEVICHNDFATYNCVFKEKVFVGLIDFDVCSPGSRIWDIAYTVYKFIPLRPIDNEDSGIKGIQFTQKEMLFRLQKFLKAYSQGEKALLYNPLEVIETLRRRLEILADWTDDYGELSQQPELHNHAKMYRVHKEWIKTTFITKRDVVL